MNYLKSYFAIRLSAHLNTAKLCPQNIEQEIKRSRSLDKARYGLSLSRWPAFLDLDIFYKLSDESRFRCLIILVASQKGKSGMIWIERYSPSETFARPDNLRSTFTQNSGKRSWKRGMHLVVGFSASATISVFLDFATGKTSSRHMHKYKKQIKKHKYKKQIQIHKPCNRQTINSCQTRFHLRH